MIVIGIDPGVETGLAIAVDGQLEHVTSLAIHDAMQLVRKYSGALVVFEDARLRARGGPMSAATAQGAGSVKRDCKIWQDYLTAIGMQFKAIKPIKGKTKVKAADFVAQTGWQGRTNEHARDAAMIALHGA